MAEENRIKVSTQLQYEVFASFKLYAIPEDSQKLWGYSQHRRGQINLEGEKE